MRTAFIFGFGWGLTMLGLATMIIRPILLKRDPDLYSPSPSKLRRHKFASVVMLVAGVGMIILAYLR